MNFLEEPYLQFQVSKNFGSALDVAITFLPAHIQAQIEKIRELENFHYSQVFDADSPIDEAILNARLDEQVPDHENLLIILAAKANELMLSGSDGVNMPIIKIPKMIGSPDTPPDELVYI